MRIVFWENIVSQHKLPYWNALAASNEVTKFVLIVEELLYKKLEKQGWENNVNETAKFELHVNPSEEKIARLLQEDMPNSYHVFSGIKAIHLVYNAFQQSLKYPLHKLLLTETVNLNGSRAITRRLFSFLIERRYQKHYDIVLGSGSSTKNWYLECGVKPENFYSFLYSIEDLEVVNSNPIDIHQLKFLFIGQLIERKGLDILLKSLSNVKNTNWTLDVFGEGEDESAIATLVKDLQLKDKVTLNGVVSNKELRNLVGQHHVLILPSRFDGWGAVVNEALASGLKVICSNKCGASILIINDKIGHVFNINNQDELTQMLEQTITKKDNIDRDYILEFSNRLKGEKVAQYLIDIINFHYKNKGERPLPPWEKFQLEKKNSVNIQNSIN
ncbi:glycosyltransferase family 4 protein [Psychroserpens damuponensis]|uniref:glycosyltransferase family 4 protein n=1 Tax=Psychroserpens damuponensis TaxID=943936 RepID=UPI00058FFD4C|nr:glycosyltransferase [Psychroserpens damuponensis]